MYRIIVIVRFYVQLTDSASMFHFDWWQIYRATYTLVVMAKNISTIFPRMMMTSRWGMTWLYRFARLIKIYLIFSHAPQIGSIYRHYKSTGWDDYTYEVIGLAVHSETLEDMIIYKMLYDSHNSHDENDIPSEHSLSALSPCGMK